MKFRTSTIIIAAVCVAFLAFLVLEFTGLIGNRAGKLPPGMVALLILLIALLVGDVSRNRATKGQR